MCGLRRNFVGVWRPMSPLAVLPESQFLNHLLTGALLCFSRRAKAALRSKQVARVRGRPPPPPNEGNGAMPCKRG